MGKLTFGSTGLSYQCDKVELNLGGTPKCPRCGGSVYFNEEKKALGKSWHKRCFSCNKCKKSLDSSNANGHDGEIFCGPCHRREFGPKGYGFAGGAAGLSTESTYHNVRPVEPIQTQVVAQHIPSQTVDRDNQDCCPRCGKKVYFAEEVKALKRKWHRLCFKCGDCRKILDASRFNEHGGEVYCQGCYSKRYGPKGYGFAGGAGNLLSSDMPQPFNNRTNTTYVHRETVQVNKPQRVETQTVEKVDGRSAMNGTSQEWTEAVYI